MILKRHALYPEVRKEECLHTMFAYTGSIPCTGRLECVICGFTSEEIYKLTIGGNHDTVQNLY